MSRITTITYFQQLSGPRMTPLSLKSTVGHANRAQIERSYGPWIKGRQDRLNKLVIGTWAKQ